MSGSLLLMEAKSLPWLYEHEVGSWTSECFTVVLRLSPAAFTTLLIEYIELRHEHYRYCLAYQKKQKGEKLMNVHRKKKKILTAEICPASASGKCITFSWVLPIIYNFSLLYTGANETGLEDLVTALTCVGGCQIAVSQSWVFINFLIFFIPTLIMITVYSKIFLIAKQQAQKTERMSDQTANASDSYKDRVARRERKAAKTLGIAVAAFLLSWLPYFIDSIIDAFLGFITPTYVYEILVWIAYYNSAMNPLIYAFFYPWFRKAIKLIVTGRILRENSSGSNLFPE